MSKKPSKEIGCFKQNPLLKHDGKNIYHMKDVKTFMMSQRSVLWMQHVSGRMCAKKKKKTRHACDFERGKKLDLSIW